MLAQLRGDGIAIEPDRLFALAELSFLYAEQENRQDYYLASAVYAYAFLFRKDGAIDEPLDSRTRLAAALYNFGLALALAVPTSPPSEEGDDTSVRHDDARRRDRDRHDESGAPAAVRAARASR